jgi:hypothetical protein
VHLGTPLMGETLDRLCATSPDLFSHDIEQDAPLGTPSQDQAQAAALDVEPGPFAAAPEGGSDAGFRGRYDSRADGAGFRSFGARRG